MVEFEYEGKIGMVKVVRTYEFPGASDIEKEVFGDEGIEVSVRPSTTEAELIKNCAGADAIICAYEPLTKNVLAQLPKLKLISFGTIGFNYADTEYAYERNIPVTNISQYCVKEVADYTVGMIVMLNRRLLQFNKSVKRDRKWDFELFPEMTRLENNTIGLLGFGNIPKLITGRLKAFGCKVIAYDPYVDAQKAKEEYGVELLSLDEVLQQSDIVSLHLPSNEATHKMINDEQIQKMKDGVMLINAARGQVIDEDAIVRAIDSEKMAYYAADVLYEEIPDLETHPFMERENIILTPHIAFYSQESLDEATTETALNVKHFFAGEFDKCQVVNGVKLT